MATIKAYSWHPTRTPIPGIVAVSNVNPLDRVAADTAAAKVAAEMSSRAVEDRALLIWAPAGYYFNEHIVKHTIKPFLLQTVDTSATRNWYIQFFTGLRSRGIELNAIIMDEESNITNWAIEDYTAKDKTLNAYLHTLWADSQVQAAMPVNLRQYTIDMVLKKNVAAVSGWNNWTLSIMYNMLRSLVVATYAQVFGRIPAVSNWGNMRGTFAIYDQNGWTCYQQQISDWSSPSCYIGILGSRYNDPIRVKDKYWNRFLDCVNYVRSAVAFNAQCMPWISFRSWLDPAGRASTQVQWLWNQFMLHAAATGVDKFLYWNPKNTTGTGSTDDDDNAVGSFIASVAQMPAVVRQLPELPMDADSVTTGSITTNYGDYAAPQNLNFQAQSNRSPVRTPFRTPVRVNSF